MNAARNAARHAIVALTLVVAGACKGEDAPKLLQTIGSHAATARLLVGELGAHHVSRRYAAVLARRLADALEQQAKTAAAAKLTASERHAVGVVLSDARRDVARAAAVAEAP
jgi:hypothetical protein